MLELEFQVAVGCQACADNQTQVLWTSSQCFKSWIHFSNPNRVTFQFQMFYCNHFKQYLSLSWEYPPSLALLECQPLSHLTWSMVFQIISGLQIFQGRFISTASCEVECNDILGPVKSPREGQCFPSYMQKARTYSDSRFCVTSCRQRTMSIWLSTSLHSSCRSVHTAGWGESGLFAGHTQVTYRSHTGFGFPLFICSL